MLKHYINDKLRSVIFRCFVVWRFVGNLNYHLGIILAKNECESCMYNSELLKCAIIKGTSIIIIILLAIPLSESLSLLSFLSPPLSLTLNIIYHVHPYMNAKCLHSHTCDFTWKLSTPLYKCYNLSLGFRRNFSLGKFNKRKTCSSGIPHVLTPLTDAALRQHWSSGQPRTLLAPGGIRIASGAFNHSFLDNSNKKQNNQIVNINTKGFITVRSNNGNIYLFGIILIKPTKSIWATCFVGVM